ncbi:AAA family ATPase [Paenibacillus silvae]|uniref:AAA family ATPase n=2 Tax=Paenibacillus silvae TaxID=1325358 RepID=UPI0020032F1E|nr:AAA family ATPase [Paenibacillus silvae]MCK6078377.1 AAA family ATPase [Paenibacillus silvae]MCK6152610.1 AAA family ATPase [Paenibacillus silvae]MCK6271212.1 AAA family ATPase [Paenibacillus silvae]
MKGSDLMQLLYLWTENYNDIFRSEEFNFGGPFRMQYESEKLIIRNSPFFIDSFFSQPQRADAITSDINNITAIIGENGTGKSSLIEHLMLILDNKTDITTLNSGLIMVFYTLKKSKRASLQIYHSFEKDPIVKCFKSINIEFKQLKLGGIPSIPRIYFSNIFDSKVMPESQATINVSTNKLLKNCLENEQDDTPDIDDYHFYETEQQIRFVNNKSITRNIIQFKLPEEITIILNPIDVNLIKYEENNVFSEFISGLIKLINKKKDRKSFFIRRILEHILVENRLYKHNAMNHLPIVEQAVQSIPISADDDVLSALKRLQNILKVRVQQNSSFLKVLQGSIRLLDYVMKLEVDHPNQNNTLSNIEVPVESELLSNILSSYYDSVRYDHYLKFKWRSLSSGELALLSIFSRLYSTREFINQQKNNNVILFIDEGEIYFHPQWQKQLISYLVDVVPSFYRNKNIQIIMTSNSPFIASDLPKTNVIFLKKIDDRSISLSELEDQHQTFAANINTLLSHSFFMQDGLMGKFAKDKINQVIDILVNKSASEIILRRNEIEALISIIGEPLIRNKLTHLLQEKLIINGMSLEERVAWLEDQINELRGK